MSLSRQEIIEKILSFNYQELAGWIKSRLQGDDGYFPIYEGYETNLSKFLSEAFYHIKDQKFRDNFLRILDELITQLYGCSKKQVKENKDYIYELLSLCGRIEDLRSKSTLYRIARSGKLKGVKSYGKDLHLMLLRAMASYQVAGDYEFWIEQMYDESNKYYANAAFYALLNRRFRLDILFEHIGVFIDRFKGEVSLYLGISALIHDYGQEEIIKRFLGIEAILSRKQKDAVNNAFIKLGNAAVYPQEDESDYTVVSSLLQKVSMPTPGYETVTPLERKAIEAFKWMGFDVESKRVIAGHLIDIFIKRKKIFQDRYECWLCFCDPGDRKVGKRKVQHLYPVREAVWRELKKETHDYIYDDCQLMIISEKGFTKGADEVARMHDIVLKTLNSLISQLVELKKHKKD